MLRVLDLFSGIGGFSLGLERAGMRTVRFCEIDPYCRKVLAKHWPDVPCHDDVITMQFEKGEADVICAGFPCQDISVARPGAGLAGARSGLFRELVRAVRLVRPKYIIVENVAGLLARGLGAVLGELAPLGYDAQYDCIPAAAVGAPHRRDRVWIVAQVPHAPGPRWHGARTERSAEEVTPRPLCKLARSDWWQSEPGIFRVAYGVPNRLDRLKSLGNSLVPQIAELIGRSIMEQGQ